MRFPPKFENYISNSRPSIFTSTQFHLKLSKKGFGDKFLQSTLHTPYLTEKYFWGVIYVEDIDPQTRRNFTRNFHEILEKNCQNEARMAKNDFFENFDI